MRRLASMAMLVAAFALVVAAPAAAEDPPPAEEIQEELEGDGHHGDVTFKSVVSNPEFLAAVINFVLLLFVFKKLGGNAISSMLVNRRKAMEESMAEAAATKAKADARYKEYTERLATLDAELLKLRTDMERAAEAENKRIAAEAEEAAKRMQAETQALIEQHAQALAIDVRREVVRAAMDVARAVVTKAINQADQEQLAEGFRARIEQLAHGKRSVRPPPAATPRPAPTSSVTGGES
jgi:F0F1-type ATP synthase membrane subunit b/b'